MIVVPRGAHSAVGSLFGPSAVAAHVADLTARIVTEALADPDAEPMERFEAIWTRVVESFDTHRPLWTASFELVAQLDQAPEVRTAVADAQQRARLGLAALFHGLDPALDEKRAWAVGSFYLALLPGVMAQWLIDPEHAPTGRDLAEALRTIVADVSSGRQVAQE